MKLSEAARTLKVVEAKAGLTRAEVIELYALTGLVAGLTGKSPRAIEAFTRLLVLDPEYKLADRYPPRVTTPFFEAKAVARENGALSLSIGGGATEAGLITTLTLKHGGSGLRLAEEVRLELNEDGVVRTVTVSANETTVPTRALAVTIRATVLGVNDRALLELAEVTLRAPAPPRVELPPASLVTTSVSASPPPLVIAEKPATSGPRLRPLAYSLLGAGVAAAVTGLFFGVSSQQAHSVLNNPPMTDGKVTLTREEALVLDRRASGHALVANSLFIGAGVAVVTGAVIWLLGAFNDGSLAIIKHLPNVKALAP